MRQLSAEIFEDTGYLIDTHTGVAATSLQCILRQKQGIRPRLWIASTVSPYKFSHSVLGAIKGKSAVEGKG